MSKKLIVADAGPLIALAKLQKLDILKHLFVEILVPETVYLEVTKNPAHREQALLVEYLSQSVTHCDDIDSEFTALLRHSLDEGEIQAIALAKQQRCGVLMDELRGRKVAAFHDIAVVGVLGVLIKAKQLGLVDQLTPLIEQLQRENYRLSKALITRVMQQVNE